MNFAAFILLLGIFSAAAEGATLRLAVSTPALGKGDPFERYIGGSIKSALFDGLTQISLTGEVTPALALSWRSITLTKWEFRLRPGVAFRNSAPLNAAAVAEVFAHIRGLNGVNSWMARQFASVRDVEASDDLTLTVVTNEPDPLLPRRMSIVNIVDMKARARAGAGAFADNPVATGPYRVDSWGPGGTDIRLTAIADAWRRAGDVASIEMKLVPEGARRVQALLSGEVDLAVNLEPDAMALLSKGGFRTAVTPNPIVIAIALKTVNAGESPMLDVRMRQALNYAVDKEAMASQILGGRMQAASQEATPGVVGFNPAIAPYPFDPARARALLAEAGYADGFEMVMAVWTGQVPGDALIFQQVAQDLGRIGVRVRLQVLPFQIFARRRADGDWAGFDAFSVNWTSRPMFDALTALDSHSCRGMTGPFFCDPMLDKATNLARHEMNLDLRTRRLQEAMELAVEAAPSIFLVNYSDVVAMRDAISGYRVRSDGILFEEMSIAEPALAVPQD